MIRWCTGSQCRPTKTGVIVVMATSPGDQVGCRILHRLESLKIDISDPDQKRVAVVQSTTKAWTKARVASVERSTNDPQLT